MTNHSSVKNRGIDLNGPSPLETAGMAISKAADPYGVTTSLLNAQMAWMMHPQELLRATNALSGDLLALQSHVMRRALGVPSPDVVEPNPDDVRFADPVWTDSATWDIIKEWYLAFTRRLEDMFFETPGLSDKERRQNQECFIRDDVQIMTATIAFGMGINKPNVRFILHYDLPKSIEGYYQEIGRAGRDGLPAHCLLLYSYSDVAKQRYFIDQKEGTERLAAIQHLDAMVKYAEDELTCRRKPLLAYFGETYTQLKCQNCDNCNAEPPQLSDITTPAQKFLSCVVRTGQRFGAAYVTEVLRGSQGERVLANQHNQLSTYGIGADLSAKQWQSISRQLVTMGYLTQEGEYRTLSLTPLAQDALKKRTRIMGQMPEVEAHPRSQQVRQSGPDYNPALFALLRQKRKELADQAGVPPYVIFSDKTLVEMAAFYPQSPEGMLKVSGVGQVKLRQYGETFQTVIREYCQAHNLSEAFPAISRRETRGTRQTRAEKSDAGRRYIFIGEAYNAGESIANLMKHYGIAQGTIVDHLARYMMAGNSLRFGSDLPALAAISPAQQAQAFAIFDEIGANLLKPAFERLGEQISYEELKVLRLLYLLDHSL